MIKDVDSFDYVQVKEAAVLKRRKGNPGRRDTYKKYKDLICAFDIETTNDDKSQQSFMYVWQAQVGDQTVMGRTWDEFKRFLYHLATMLDEHVYIVFFVHNLSFEFQWLKGIYQFEPEEVFAMDARKVLKCEMMGHFEFRCSYLQTNMSLAEFTHKMGVEDAKLSGEEFDYSIARYPWTELTPREIEYCVNDVKGLCEAMRKQMELDHDNLYSLVLTSTGYVRRDVKAAMRHFNQLKLKQMLPDYDIYKMLSEAFRGGNTHANRYYSGLIIEDVKSRDRASSYPDVQINRLFPMGPWIREPEADFDRVLVKIFRQGRACLMRLKLWNVKLKDPLWGCPYLARAKCRDIIGGDYDNGRILEASFLECTVTDIDLKIIMEEYTFEYAEVNDLAHCRYGVLPKPMRDTVLEYFHRKTDLKGVAGQELYYMKAKNKLNSVYGMSVQDPVKRNMLYINGMFQEDDSVSDPELLEKSNRKAFQSYAWGVWTTCWARYELERAIKLVGDGFLYADTDSVKYIGDVDFSVLNKELTARSKANGAVATDPKGRNHYLGVWEEDGSYMRFSTLGSKKYCYEDADGLHITIAGVSKKKGAEELQAHGGIEAFRPGFVFHESAGIEAVYNDEPAVKELIREGRKIDIISNVYMRDSEYTLGITGEYMRLLDRADEWRKANRKF